MLYHCLRRNQVSRPMCRDKYIIKHSGNDENIQHMFNISVLYTEAHFYHHLMVLSQKAKNVLCSIATTTALLSKSFLAYYLTLLSLHYFYSSYPFKKVFSSSILHQAGFQNFKRIICISNYPHFFLPIILIKQTL